MKRNAQKNTQRATKKAASAGNMRSHNSIPKTVALVNKNVPTWIKTNMIYSDWKPSGIITGATVPGVQLYSANGLYDPDLTSIGRQPAGYDSYMGIYERYLVTRATIKVCFTVYPQELTGVVVGISVQDNPAAAGSVERYIENGDSTFALVGRDWQSKTLTLSVDIRKFFARDIWNIDDYQGVKTSNPPDQVYFHVWAKADNAVTATVGYVAQINYETYFRGFTLKTLD